MADPVMFVTSYEVIPLRGGDVPEWYNGEEAEFLCRVTRTWGNKGLPITDRKPVAVFVTDSEGALYRDMLRELQEQGLIPSQTKEPA
jgi:hypothetical protein